MLAIPKQPELYTHNNGLIVIRYPQVNPKTQKTRSRNFKLGFGLDDKEQQRQLEIFKKEQGKMTGATNGAAAPKAIKPNNKARALTTVPKYLQGKTPEEIEAIRKKNRDNARTRQHNLKAAAATPQDFEQRLAQLQDHIAVIASSLGAVSTSVRMVQDMVTTLQQKQQKQQKR